MRRADLSLTRCDPSTHHRLDFWSYHSVKVIPDRAMSRADVRRLLALPSVLREQIVVDANLMRVTAS